jgi:hypothetical protein
MKCLIKLIEEKLSDGSVAFNVQLSDKTEDTIFAVLFTCVTEKDALALQEKLAAAIEAHTLDEPVVR